MSVIQFALPPCVTPDLEEAVEGMKEQFGPDLGAYALVCWNRRGTEYSTAYSSGPVDVEELPSLVMAALEERLDLDDEDFDFIAETNDNKIIEKLTTIGIVRDDSDA
jgi:hypothetical protein